MVAGEESRKLLSMWDWVGGSRGQSVSGDERVAGGRIQTLPTVGEKEIRTEDSPFFYIRPSLVRRSTVSDLKRWWKEGRVTHLFGLLRESLLRIHAWISGALWDRGRCVRVSGGLRIREQGCWIHDQVARQEHVGERWEGTDSIPSRGCSAIRGTMVRLVSGESSNDAMLSPGVVPKPQNKLPDRWRAPLKLEHLHFHSRTIDPCIHPQGQGHHLITDGERKL